MDPKLSFFLKNILKSGVLKKYECGLQIFPINLEINLKNSTLEI